MLTFCRWAPKISTVPTQDHTCVCPGESSHSDISKLAFPVWKCLCFMPKPELNTLIYECNAMLWRCFWSNQILVCDELSDLIRFCSFYRSGASLVSEKGRVLCFWEQLCGYCVSLNQLTLATVEKGLQTVECKQSKDVSDCDPCSSTWWQQGQYCSGWIIVQIVSMCVDIEEIVVIIIHSKNLSL